MFVSAIVNSTEWRCRKFLVGPVAVTEPLLRLLNSSDINAGLRNEISPWPIIFMDYLQHMFSSWPLKYNYVINSLQPNGYCNYPQI
jgi:hypothetical protein